MQAWKQRVGSLQIAVGVLSRDVYVRRLTALKKTFGKRSLAYILNSSRLPKTSFLHNLKYVTQAGVAVCSEMCPAVHQFRTSAGSYALTKIFEGTLARSFFLVIKPPGNSTCYVNL